MGGMVSGLFGGGDDAADASRDASRTAAASEREALDYLKQTEAIPQAYREQALGQLGSLYGLPGVSPTSAPGGQSQAPMTYEQFVSQQGGRPSPTVSDEARYATGGIFNLGQPEQATDSRAAYDAYLSGQPQGGGQPQAQVGGGAGSTQDFMDRVRQSPLYEAILGGQQAGEEAILRQAGATGGLRSGNVQHNLYDYNTQLQNRALLESYNQQVSGLQGLAQTPSNANAIASGMAGIGNTLAQGQIAGAQAQQAGQQQQFGNIMGIGSIAADAGAFTGLGGAISSFMASDPRLKENIEHVGYMDGHKWYTWTWNKIANDIGFDGECQGVMADEAHAKVPEAVSFMNGFLFVDYSKLGSVH